MINAAGTYIWSDQASTTQWTKSVDVSSLAEGEYKLAIVLYDNNGNVNDTSYQTYSYIGWVSFYYDKTAPTGSISNQLVYRTTDTMGTYTGSVTTWDSLSGVSHTVWYVDYTPVGGTQTRIISDAVGTTTSYSFTLQGEGAYHLSIVVVDRAGNYFEIWRTQIITLVVDATPPTYANYTVSKTYTNNNQESILVSVEVADFYGISEVRLNAWIGESYDTEYTSKIATYNSTTGKYEAYYTLAEVKNTVTGEINQGDGQYIFHGRAVDVAGNACWIGEASVYLDTFAPTAGSVQINSNAKYTRTPGVTLILSAADALSGVAQMAISNTETIGTYETYATSKSWTLTTGDGLKTVYVVFKDAAGNATVSF